MIAVLEVADVLATARAKKALLAAELTALKAAFAAAPTMENFHLYYDKKAELALAATRLTLLEQWAEGLF
jgi:hypothetical protein